MTRHGGWKSGGRPAAVLLIAAMLALGAALAVVPGCANPEREAQRTQQIDSDLSQKERQLEDARAKPDVTPQQREEIDRLLADVRQDRATLADRLSKLQAAQSAAASEDPLIRIVGSVAGWIPAPFGGLVTLGLPLAAAGLKLWRTDSAAKSIARSMETLKTSDPAFAEAFSKYAGVLDGIQTNKAKAIVDAAQGKAIPLTSRLL